MNRSEVFRKANTKDKHMLGNHIINQLPIQLILNNIHPLIKALFKKEVKKRTKRSIRVTIIPVINKEVKKVNKESILYRNSKYRHL